MWKKAVPAVAMCSLLLVGCNTTKTVPTKNETPMQDVRQGVDRVIPNANPNINPNVNPNLTTPETYTPTPGINNTTDYYRGNNKGVNNVGPNVVPDGNVIKGTTGTTGTTGVKGQTR